MHCIKNKHLMVSNATLPDKKMKEASLIGSIEVADDEGVHACEVRLVRYHEYTRQGFSEQGRDVPA